MDEYLTFLFFSALAIILILLVGLLFHKITTPKYVAANAVFVALAIFFFVSPRLQKLSIPGSLTMETQVDQARTYAAQIRAMKDELVKESVIAEQSARKFKK